MQSTSTAGCTLQPRIAVAGLFKAARHMHSAWLPHAHACFHGAVSLVSGRMLGLPQAQHCTAWPQDMCAWRLLSMHAWLHLQGRASCVLFVCMHNTCEREVTRFNRDRSMSQSAVLFNVAGPL